jgi:hypothetical protein
MNNHIDSSFGEVTTKVGAALDLIGRGFRIFPLLPNSKIPAIKGWKEKATRNPDLVRQVWESGDYNIGVYCEDMIVVDVDVKHGKPGLASLMELGIDLATYTVRTPSGGLHLYYAGANVSLSAGRIGAGLDVRSGGGYVVGPGSTIDGTAYVIERDAAIVPAEQGLIDRCGQARTPGERGLAPAVDLDRPDTLERARIYLAEEAPVAVEGASGDSTTFKVAARLRDFGVSEHTAAELMAEIWNPRCRPPWPDDELRQKVSNAYAYAANQPGCDHPEAAFACVAMPPTEGQSRHFGILAVSAASETGSWDAPDFSVIDVGEIASPAFPLDLLGSEWAGWCRQAAEAANSPIDYVGAGLLTIAAALIGNARVAKVGSSWTEPPVVWVILVGPPSSGKSPALDPLVKIVEALEAALAKDFEATLRQHDAAAARAKVKLKQWTKGLEDAFDDGAPVPLDAVEPDRPKRPRIMISDATIESVADIASGNAKGLILVRDEIAGWWRGFNRYGGDGGGDAQFWLQAYGARPFTVDRKTAAKPIRISRLAVSILGGVQPGVVAGFLRREDDGLAARFLWVYPAARKGFLLSKAAIDHRAASEALLRLWALAGTLGAGDLEPRPCPLDDDAAIRFEAWWAATRDRFGDNQGAYGEWLGKAGGLALRLALVLEHLWWSASAFNEVGQAESNTVPDFGSGGGPERIGLKAVQAAITLIDDWAAPHARRVYNVTGITESERGAVILARWLVRQGCSSFNAREVRRNADGPGGGLSNSHAMSAACQLLVDAGLIRPVDATGKPGRKPQAFEVNPLLLGPGSREVSQ